MQAGVGGCAAAKRQGKHQHGRAWATRRKRLVEAVAGTRKNGHGSVLFGFEQLWKTINSIKSINNFGSIRQSIKLPNPHGDRAVRPGTGADGSKQALQGGTGIGVGRLADPCLAIELSA